MNKFNDTYMLAAIEEIDCSLELLSTERNYHGAEKHSKDWHDGWETCAKHEIRTLKMIKKCLEQTLISVNEEEI